MLSIDSSLLYLVGEPTDPIVVWKMLAAPFQKKTWANKLHLRRKLYSLNLKEGGSVQEHIKAMTETFNELSVIGDPITEEDRVVHLLASLPDPYNVLVTALEANADVPKIDVVTERKNMDIGTPRYDSEKMMTVRRKFNGGPNCYHGQKFGHTKRNCPALMDMKPEWRQKKVMKPTHKAHGTEARHNSYSNDESVGCVALHDHALLTAAGEINIWIVDSGATCHMCNDRGLFIQLCNLKEQVDVTLGDGHCLVA